MNIFLGVYACEPNNGSEPEVGWQMVNEIAKAMPNDTIYALTKLNNKDVIEAEGYPDNVKFFYYAPPKWFTFWKKGGRGIRTYYYLWLIGAALFMKKQNINFDIVHHITFVNDWLPSYFYLLKTNKNKFIWGPIGSHDPIEEKFLDGSRRKNIEKIRIFLQLFFRNFDPSFYICKAKADCIIGINENVRKKLNLSDNKIFISEPAIGMRKSILENMVNIKKDSDLFVVISVGRLLYIKNFKLTIISFAKFLKNNSSIQNARLQIIGDGTDRKSLENLSVDLGIEKYIEFTGNIPLHKVQEQFSKANLFLFPTLENAGFVTLEAMSHSLPVVAMKYGGPEQFIKNNMDEQLVLSTQSYDDIASSIAKKLEFFYNDQALTDKVGKQNRQDVLDNFTWEAKAQKMKKLYRELLNENKN
jgi:glycosyltransferase involved in cell wall biosynthesis